ncbi:hypothetical protein [Pararhodobacter sp.]|uniref:hypothetical protein n=1 Tax=Pararhodobacter sp. TaxID=2127056 RepID=UPI002AFDFC58|nr:hypothetical protein [Pararhodobacter sp.]
MSQERMHNDPFDRRDEAALEALFSEARLAEPDPVPEGLRLRLLADAAAAVPAEAPRGWLARLGGILADLGGVPGLAGVGAAGVAGVWIGFAGPGLTGDLVTQFWQGAATVSPTVSTWVDAGPMDASDADLLVLMSGDGE